MDKFKRVNDIASGAVDRVLSHWLPGGKMKGVEYVVRNPTRDDKTARSFTINTKKGIWSDFASGDGGADWVSLIAYVENKKQSEACQILGEFLGASLISSKQQPKPVLKKVALTRSWVPVVPVPTEAKIIPIRHFDLGEPVSYWDYRDQNSNMMMRVCRFQTAQGDKQYRPLTYCQKDGHGEGWRWLGLPDNRPLFNLDKIFNSPEKTVLLCEGEKAVIAAESLFPDFVCSTWPNGSKSIGRVDFSPLSGKRVVYWHDNDQAGLDSIEPLKQKLIEVGVQIFEVLNLSCFEKYFVEPMDGDLYAANDSCWPEKADAYDALEKGWRSELLLDNFATTILHEKGISNKANAPINENAYLENVPFGYKLNGDGLFFINLDSNERDAVSAPIHVVARSRTEHSRNWGVLVTFNNFDNLPVEWNIPMQTFASEGGSEIIRGLYDRGFKIEGNRKSRTRLLEYLSNSDPQDRITLVDKMGWYKGAFVLPDRIIGNAADRVHYYAENLSLFRPEQSGTISSWKDTVASYCAGNDLLTFAISSAFLAPLVELLSPESFGFHFVGDSSLGKSTLLKVASSVYGNPQNYPKTWRATDNAIEAIAAAHSGCLLIIDEIGQCDSRIIGETIYMLGQGQGKARANDRGGAKDIQHRWKLAFLSSGEKTLNEHMSESGKKVKPGQDLRLLAIPACWHESETVRKQKGIFNELHNFNSGAELSDYLVTAAVKSHGTVFIEYLQALVKSTSTNDGISEKWEQYKVSFVASVLAPNIAGQSKRSADKFAMAGFAGELATSYGLTGWVSGLSTQAAKENFRYWIELRGGVGNIEEKQLLEQIKTKLLKHGEANFTRWDQGQNDDAQIDEHTPRTMERWGFRQTNSVSDIHWGKSSSTIYYVFVESFKKELCHGFDHKRALVLLNDLEALDCAGADKSKNQYIGRKRLPGVGRNAKAVVAIKLDKLID